MPVPKCFENFLGVRTPCLPESNAPVSGFYINQIPGISLQNAAQIHNAEQVSAFKFLREVIDNATAMLVEEMAGELNKVLRFKAVLELDKVGEFSDTFLATEADKKKGLVFCRKKSRLTEMFIQEISFLCNNSTTEDLFIIDETMSAPDAYNFTSEIGVPVTVQINKAYAGNEIFIYVPTDTLIVNESELFVQESCGCGSQLKTAFDYKYITVEGATEDALTGERTKGLAGSFGFNVSFALNCSRQLAACFMRNELKLPVLYKSGLQYALEWQMSDRINAASTLNSDSAKRLEKYCREELEKALKSFRSTAAERLVKIDSSCAACRGVITADSYL